jgi:hypothetical protein
LAEFWSPNWCTARWRSTGIQSNRPLFLLLVFSITLVKLSLDATRFYLWISPAWRIWAASEVSC